VRNLPTGTVTFLFTDIEGSTRLLRELGGNRYAEALAHHRRVIRSALAAHGGVEVDKQGDAFFIAFETAAGAVATAHTAQTALGGGSIAVRMGIHTGDALVTEEGYVGPAVHAGARIAAAGHGGQVLVSKAAADELDASFPLVDLGEHRLKDLEEPVWIFQLGDGAFPPLKTLSNTNLPAPASSFVGRERELDDAGLLLGRTRLLTVLGPGGAGKTRFAIELASRALERFPNGVFWVGLAPLRDPTVVLETAARTVGATNGLATHVGAKRMLLLIDNLEQVIEAAPELASLAETCPNLTLLVTSRELMRVRGERSFTLPPLAVDEGVALFCERAGVEPSDAVTELSRRLDGLPLALELAAARATVLLPEQLLERLAQRLDLLRGGRDADPRQETLRATIEWSHDLLTPPERRLFARLAVFAGGCTLETAELVADADLDTLQALVEKSLLRRTEERFWMLETIRAFALEQLEASGEADLLRRRHAERFRELAVSLGMAWETVDRGAVQRHDLAIPEQDNFRAAIDWAAEADVELALRLAVELENFWVTRNPFEGRRRFEALLGRAGDVSPALRARALRCYGGSTLMSGDDEEGTRLYEQSLELYESVGDELGTAIMRQRLGACATHVGDLAKARVLLEDGLARFRRLGSRVGEAQALAAIGFVDYQEGNVARGREEYQRAAELAREAGFAWWEMNTFDTLADLALEQGRPDEAEEHALAALELSRRIGDRQFSVFELAQLARTAAARGDAERAGWLWGAIEAEEARGAIGRWEHQRDEVAKAVLAACGPAFEDGRAEGRRLPLADAVAYALGDGERSNSAA
jgi:predicted ATPase/class 3 adenylate cyclase